LVPAFENILGNRASSVKHKSDACSFWRHRFEHRGVFENRVLRRICGPKRDKRIGDWSRLHNEELHNLYFSTNISK
jgi:hypothetical protein